MRKRKLKNKVLILDRDGTIIVEKNYLKSPENVELLDNTAAGLEEIKKLGFVFIVITNQSGIARTYFTEKEFNEVNIELDRQLENFNVKIEKYYMCPHHPDFSGECTCRKPKPELALRAIEDFNIDVEKSWFVGDKCSDINCGKNSGLKTALVLTGYGNQEKNKCNPDIIVSDLLELAEFLKKQTDMTGL